MEQMGISFVAIDLTRKEEFKWKELKRTDAKLLPANLIYPPNYPEEPAIKMESLFGPAEVNKVLDRMDEIVSGLEEV